MQKRSRVKELKIKKKQLIVGLSFLTLRRNPGLYYKLPKILDLDPELVSKISHPYYQYLEG
jgi:hypothetical protein